MKLVGDPETDGDALCVECGTERGVVELGEWCAMTEQLPVQVCVGCLRLALVLAEGAVSK